MCIRDRAHCVQWDLNRLGVFPDQDLHAGKHAAFQAVILICLLYTSDAADERSSVDLGGRRIIKQKKTDDYGGSQINDNIKKNK